MKGTLISVFLLIICTPVFASTLTVALFDISGSVLTDNTGSEGKNSPYSKNMYELKREINELGKGDTIIVIGFSRKSDVILKATMPKQAGPMNRNLVTTRDAATRKLEENITNRARSIDSTRTDVIGCLFRASRFIAESNSPEVSVKKISIYSDMLDNVTAGLSLNRLKNANYKIFLTSLENKKVGFPDLKGVEVNIYSAFSDIKDITTVQTEVAIKNLKAFWSDYLVLKCGSNVKSYRTTY